MQLLLAIAAAHIPVYRSQLLSIRVYKTFISHFHIRILRSLGHFTYTIPSQDNLMVMMFSPVRNIQPDYIMDYGRANPIGTNDPSLRYETAELQHEEGLS